MPSFKRGKGCAKLPRVVKVIVYGELKVDIFLFAKCIGEPEIRSLLPLFFFLAVPFLQIERERENVNKET